MYSLALTLNLGHYITNCCYALKKVHKIIKTYQNLGNFTQYEENDFKSEQLGELIFMTIIAAVSILFRSDNIQKSPFPSRCVRSV